CRMAPRMPGFCPVAWQGGTIRCVHATTHYTYHTWQRVLGTPIHGRVEGWRPARHTTTTVARLCHSHHAMALPDTPATTSINTSHTCTSLQSPATPKAPGHAQCAQCAVEHTMSSPAALHVCTLAR